MGCESSAYFASSVDFVRLICGRVAEDVRCVGIVLGILAALQMLEMVNCLDTSSATVRC